MIESSHTPKYLQKHQYQGQSNDCGPYCTAILLNYMRKTDIRGEQLGELMNKIAWKGIFPVIQRIKNWATFPWGVCEQFRAHGVKARWRVFTRPEILLSNLVRNIHTILIIGELRPKPWAHYLILSAYDAQKGWGFINSALSSPRIDWIPEAKFEQMWRAYGRISISIEPVSPRPDEELPDSDLNH